MSRTLCHQALTENSSHTRIGAVLLAILTLFAGCRSASDSFKPGAPQSAVTPDLDAEIAQASSLRQPVLILVMESGLSPADDRARRLFETLTAKDTNIVSVLLDLSVSRNRATAARFHVTVTPLLLGLSPEGLIITRDEKPLTKELVESRIEEIAQQALALDAKLTALNVAVAREGKASEAQWELAQFLLAHQNAREAIPRLEAIAHSESADPGRRVQAWVELAKAHLWVAEPEKGRHEAEALIAVLGSNTPEARAGGDLVLGTQDANAKRFALARQELAAAIADAPGSDYARQASDALAKISQVDK